MSPLPDHSMLGKVVAYSGQYDARLLFPIERAQQRAELGIAAGATAPFFGADVWTCYEVSWLNPKGKPQVAIAVCTVPADSPRLIESKSFKLYLNSFNETRLANAQALHSLLQHDLSDAAGASVSVRLIEPQGFAQARIGELEGVSLDRLDIETDRYTPAPEFLSADHAIAPHEEVLVSHLLKSNCPVTGQPDWGSVQIRYHGAPIEHGGLLKYLISFRLHNEFHEHCVERIFMDIMARCRPQRLAVYARYTRRGGLDINPFRTNFACKLPENLRTARQ
jgi:7-cyano-7-deazaguanine reductase